MNESDAGVEVCVEMMNPPPTEDLVFTINLKVTTMNITATGMYNTLLN